MVLESISVHVEDVRSIAESIHIPNHLVISAYLKRWGVDKDPAVESVE